MASTPLIVGEKEKEALKKLRDLAAANPIDMPPLIEALKTAEGKEAHIKRMTEQTVIIPFGFFVTFSIEINHPSGTMRHMSMSSPVAGRVPHPAGVWMVAQELGFVGALEQCMTWFEDLQRTADQPKRKAINVVQPVRQIAGGTA